jgi:hypothetical protein
MDQITAVLLAAAIGALAGIAGAAFGALGSVRASQLAARAPLAEKIHGLAQSTIKLRAAIGTPDFASRLNDFNIAWNDFAVHQKLLAPSYRIASINDLVFKAALQAQGNPNAFVDLAGQALSVVTDMIAAHSTHVLRSQALRAEKRFLNQWLATEKSQVMSNDLREIIKKLAAGKRMGPYG